MIAHWGILQAKATTVCANDEEYVPQTHYPEAVIPPMKKINKAILMRADSDQYAFNKLSSIHRSLSDAAQSVHDKMIKMYMTQITLQKIWQGRDREEGQGEGQQGHG